MDRGSVPPSPPPFLMIKTKKVVCKVCNKEFERSEKRLNYSSKIGSSTVCSRKCSNAILKIHAGNRQDAYSPFKYFVNRSQSSDRVCLYGESDINASYLKDLWESQKGVCPYTGYKMHLPRNTAAFKKNDNPKRVSLDRIDSNLGYVKGNVEFVCYVVNLAKNEFPRDEIISFFRDIPKDNLNTKKIKQSNK